MIKQKKQTRLLENVGLLTGGKNATDREFGAFTVKRSTNRTSTILQEGFYITVVVVFYKCDVVFKVLMNDMVLTCSVFVTGKFDFVDGKSFTLMHLHG